MTFLIITSVRHVSNETPRSYLPYVREMNIWIRHAQKVIILAPFAKSDESGLLLSYEHPNIEVVSIPEIDSVNGVRALRTLFLLPVIAYRMLRAMKRADHIHLRCPGNIGLIGCVLQFFFPNTKKTVKYAGNWDPNAARPASYRLQQKLVSHVGFSRNMTVLAYGHWKGDTSNILPSFTASYRERDIRPFETRTDVHPFRFVFAGMLVRGKNPLYAVQLVEALNVRFPCTLDIFGDGPERVTVEAYTASKQLTGVVTLHGNQGAERVAEAYRKAHFALLPSVSEGWPKAIAEGMFWGCVPLALPVSCVGEMLGQGERGELLQMELKEDVERVQQLLADPDLLDRKARNAYTWSIQYTIEAFEREVQRLLTP